MRSNDARGRNAAIFEEMSVPRAVWTMSVPAVVSQLIVLIYNMADTFFIGRTNNPSMVAGASLILPMFNITLSLAGLAGTGGGALASRLLGERRGDEVRRVFSFCVWLGALSAGLFSLVMLLFMKPLLGALGADANTYQYARAYALCVIVCGGVPTVLSNVLSTFLRSIGDSARAGFGIMLGGLINIALDPLFMFALLPDGMEIAGAGVATCLSNCIALGYFVAVLRRMGDESGLKLCSPRKLPAKERIASIFAVGAPSAVATLLFDLDYVVIDKLMSGYGNAALAAVGIVLKAERLPLNVGVGICQGMMPIVGYNFAARNLRRMNDTRRYALRLGLGFALLSVALYELFAGQVMRLFIDDAQTVALGTSFLRARAVATPLMFLSFFHVYLFNGFGEGGRALLLGVTRWLGFNIPMLFALNALLGMYGIVWGQACADALTVLVSVIVYRRYSMKYL